MKTHANTEETQSPTGNPSFQSVDEIHQLVINHVKQKIDQKLFEPTIQLRKLSPEIKLGRCQTAIQIEDKNLDNIAGRMTISAICLQPKWRVFVPVTVDGKQPVVISTKGILKKAVIQEGDVKQELVHYKKIPSGSMINASKAVGMRAKKAIPANQILRIRDLQPPYWVFKNQQVNIVTRIGGIEVKTTGTALKNGVVDEQVPIQNSSSQKTIKGIVIAPNTVLVP
ncbi:flagellar basal body P-ring biosynthesis protein FlgA [Thiomicrorhabdus immobilis]|uniref:Flagella basal body P-ring formation protein FlgA n=2 Tax=Thiomicrorhabdus immobilis TaxID=2791037 RepID=A0ABM7MCC4_9GAMM|nr:flagellar basal body P-ring biosynthesis protein FlgA [Thiomicrorhabdus immobilis]